jgi:hypothetical protein
MKKRKVKTKEENLKADIKNSTRFFQRSGDDTKKAYDILDDNIAGVHGNIETVFLNIPGDIQDVYDFILN